MLKPLVLLIALSPAAALAQDTVLSQDALAGEQIYLDHCATCHGLDATGFGPTAPALILQPTNLTLLSAGNGGVFPTFRVVARIDGRDPLVSHGSPMPVYGDFFEGKGIALPDASGQPIMTSQPIADIVAYLEGLQQ
ncbi:MAG: cytochrome c [Paracoccaceae bacterium]